MILKVCRIMATVNPAGDTKIVFVRSRSPACYIKKNEIFKLFGEEKMKTKIFTFLKERQDRFKPEEANKLGLKRLQKINFSGNMHLVEKLTNTNMILIKSGDLVISGINVEKGALAVYQGDIFERGGRR